MSNPAKLKLMTDLDSRILQSIEAKPGQKAAQLATNLGIDRKAVNSRLYGPLKGRVQQDSTYRWYVKGHADGGKPNPIPAATPLAKISRYYLDCLSHDDLGGVSEFAASAYNPPNYVELPALPMVNSEGDDPFDTDAGRQFLGRVKRDRNRKTLFLGYPVRLNLIRSRKSNWEGFKVEPLLLFPFQEAGGSTATPRLGEDLPQINFQALRSLSNERAMQLMEQAIQLSEELGLGNAAGDQPDLDELVSRLRDVRPDWDWIESPDPYTLSTGVALAGLTDQGIYNRAILASAERSPFTKGLESELGMLQSVEESKYRETALGSWLGRRAVDAPAAGQEPPIEALPLNSEQRQAVRQALSNPLTVITGPPGTGKSQVVTSILVNAAWHGKSVLFASKNNKAVDVVEARVNAVGPRPILLRLGTNEYRSRLADHLVSLLAASVGADDRERYQQLKTEHEQLQRNSAALEAELQEIIELRNEVDMLEQRVEQIRQEFGDDRFGQVRSADVDKVRRAASQVLVAIDQTDRTRQPILTKLFWPFLRGRRFEQLMAVAEPFSETARHLGVPLPRLCGEESTAHAWVEYGRRLAARIGQLCEVRDYFAKLASLTGKRPIENISRLRLDLTENVAANSEALWNAWLRLQPARMGPEQRKLLGDYVALLQLIASADDQGRSLGRDVFRRYYALFPQIMPLLPCWAVTSLSVRGRVPFHSSFFDILVVDEASQCDIASALPLLFRARRVVVIGDPMQLRHISTLSKKQDQQLLSKHGLLEEFPGWSYSTRSLFDLASSLCRSEDIVTLRDHHRSHTDIIEFSNGVFYEGRLRVATRHDRLRRPREDEPAVRWVDIRGRATRPGTGGAVNEREACEVVAEIERLVRQGYRGSIGVISPFRAQANRIRDLACQQSELSSRLDDMGFLVDTVHKFQGDERDVMFFSPVVSDGVSESALGFLKNNPNLFNVAVTRARSALVVVGDRTAASGCNVDYLSRFASYVEQLGRFRRPVGRPDTSALGPDYPIVTSPELVSEWEKVFYRAMYATGIRAVPQYPVERYILDFAVIQGDRRLNIEIDGERYHRNWDGELCRRDQIRNQRLLELGWDVMRFWVYQVRDDLDRCIARVREWTQLCQ